MKDGTAVDVLCFCAQGVSFIFDLHQLSFECYLILIFFFFLIDGSRKKWENLQAYLMCKMPETLEKKHIGRNIIYTLGLISRCPGEMSGGNKTEDVSVSPVAK